MNRLRIQMLLNKFQIRWKSGGLSEIVQRISMGLRMWSIYRTQLATLRTLIFQLILNV